jgi:hypothetical protein
MVAVLETANSNRPQRLSDKDWNELLRQISKGRCTPFIGPEACCGLYPLKGDRAEQWAKDEDYPLDDRRELARVAQFLAVSGYEAKPIERLIDEFQTVKSPDYTNANELHSVLAGLPLPVYITTNYDDFMLQAFQKRTMPRDALREYSRWRKGMSNDDSVLNGEYKPTVANPIVFHLYGHVDEEQSLVLTENDFLKFLISVSREEKVIPPVIQAAIAGGSLLFLGYRLDEWDFRILFHTLATYLEHTLSKAHVSVQIIPIGHSATAEQREKAINYLNSYFDKQVYHTRIYWGSCHEFVEELRERWEASNYAK